MQAIVQRLIALLKLGTPDEFPARRPNLQEQQRRDVLNALRAHEQNESVLTHAYRAHLRRHNAREVEAYLAELDLDGAA